MNNINMILALIFVLIIGSFSRVHAMDIDTPEWKGFSNIVARIPEMEKNFEKRLYYYPKGIDWSIFIPSKENNGNISLSYLEFGARRYNNLKEIENAYMFVTPQNTFILVDPLALKDSQMFSFIRDSYNKYGMIQMLSFLEIRNQKILHPGKLGFTVCSKAHRRYAASGAHLQGTAKSGVCLHNCTMFFDLFYVENPLGERDFQIF